MRLKSKSESLHQVNSPVISSCRHCGQIEYWYEENTLYLCLCHMLLILWRLGQSLENRSNPAVTWSTWTNPLHWFDGASLVPKISIDKIKILCNKIVYYKNLEPYNNACNNHKHNHVFRTPYKSSTLDGDPVKQKALTTWLSGGFVSNQLKIPLLQYPVRNASSNFAQTVTHFNFELKQQSPITWSPSSQSPDFTHWSPTPAPLSVLHTARMHL